VLDVDIKSFFDTIDDGQLRVLLDQRVRDGVLRRMIDQWLKAGVLEEGAVHYPDGGTPQGGVIAPLLANIYLHHVLDTCFYDMAKPKLPARFIKPPPTSSRKGGGGGPATFDLLGFTHYWRQSHRGRAKDGQ
jgi:Reverse transcriptase (RNA-dependent DNA polymerase)